MAGKRARRTRASRESDYPGWLWMLFGLAIGLSVALAIYVKDHRPPVAAGGADRPAEAGAAPSRQAPATAAEPGEPPPSRFDFYDMLPKFEVIIPDQEPDVTQDSVMEVVDEPGLYVLQAGSFTRYEDADRRRAELALQGIESRIQRVTIDDRTFHRVRIGPIDKLEELNRIRGRLREADIDVLRIRLDD